LHSYGDLDKGTQETPYVVVRVRSTSEIREQDGEEALQRIEDGIHLVEPDPPRD
jgi:hypothetical protein